MSTMREEFEAWLGNRLHGNEKFYAWEAWQAARAVPDDMVMVKRSAIHCANHMATLIDLMLKAFNDFYEADQREDEEAMDRLTETLNEYRNGLRDAAYEYRKRLPPAPSAREGNP
jgi:hypothetical protein